MVEIDIENIKCIGSEGSVITEASKVQEKRNKIIHQGIFVEDIDAELAIRATYEVLHIIVYPMLLKLDLWMDKTGTVSERKDGIKP